MMKGKEKLRILTDGIWKNNPVLVQLLGMCATLAVTTSLQNGLGMGLATTFVLIGSNIVISLLRKVIPDKIRIAAYVVVIAGFVTCVEMLMKAYLVDLSNSLGLFIPLIVVNCIILARAEAFASKHTVVESALDGVGMGLGFTLALCLMSAVRELIGNGTLAGITILGEGYQPALMAILPPGGFIVLGCIIALVQHIGNKREAKR